MGFRRTFTDSDFSVAHCLSRSVNPAHAHKDYVLTYHLLGLSRSRVGSDSLFEFRPGDVNLLNPGDMHRDFASSLNR